VSIGWKSLLSLYQRMMGEDADLMLPSSPHKEHSKMYDRLDSARPRVTRPRARARARWRSKQLQKGSEPVRTVLTNNQRLTLYRTGKHGRCVERQHSEGESQHGHIHSSQSL
jgi:hypothetical protein